MGPLKLDGVTKVGVVNGAYRGVIVCNNVLGFWDRIGKDGGEWR